MSRRAITLMVRARALKLAAQGLSSRKIVAALGGKVDRATVSRWLMGEDIVKAPPAQPAACLHTRIVVPGLTCADCGVVMPPPPPTPAPTFPEWVREKDASAAPVTIEQPSWRL